ncbi:hypothetical protein CC80DRAFT_11370 [Byssothecium circinans]|uniref:Uncharacterized protein n=1 Tax=Byssothecium circinans TaxID=147558 RepID=A0A6A5UEN5_9PLEO|nr:hypothetical protein CC80DRAFT_11370 [Byssothecium circinans]
MPAFLFSLEMVHKSAYICSGAADQPGDAKATSFAGTSHHAIPIEVIGACESASSFEICRNV